MREPLIISYSCGCWFPSSNGCLVQQYFQILKSICNIYNFSWNHNPKGLHFQHVRFLKNLCPITKDPPSIGDGKDASQSSKGFLQVPQPSNSLMSKD